MQSALQRPEVIGEYLARECAEGRVIGPLDRAQFPMVHTRRFGVIPKGSTGKWCLILDLSSPEGHRVNDGIQESLCSLSYMSVDDAVYAVREKGRGTLLAKVDIRSAYRIVPVHPEDWWLLGMLWDGSIYIDTALPFGLKSAPKIFNAVADTVEWIAKQQGVGTILHHLDDFLIVGDPGPVECAAQLTILLAVAMEKLEGPATVLTFLSIEMDTSEMALRLPEQKLQELKQLVARWIGKRSCLKRDIQSLVGKLQHACKVVVPGRTFLRRMFELLSITAKSQHHIRLNQAFRSDLLWWHTFLSSWNGVSMMRGLQSISPNEKVFTDASGVTGCGAWWGKSWLQLKWVAGMAFGSLPITQKEVLPVVLACVVWGWQWYQKTVLVHCDNEAAVTVLNSGYSRDPHIMHLLRRLFFIKAHFQINLRATHIPGAENIQADAISRDLIVALFFSQVPEACRSPTPIPPPVLALLVEKQPDWTSPTWAKLFGSCLMRD